MNIEIPQNCQIVIIEGIPGSGKDTVQNYLREKFQDKLIYNFSEDDLLFSWRHGWIPKIDEMRLALHENLLKYIENIINQDPNSLFILNRLHISYILYTKTINKNLDQKYNTILDHLRKLNSFIIAPTVIKKEIEERSSHKERKDPLWQNHLQKRLIQENFSSIEEMYSHQQDKIIKTLKNQKINYQILEINN